MQFSEPCDSVVKALVAARRRFPPIPKNSKVKVKTKAGGEYEYEYATLDSILDAVVPILGEEGLVPVFGVEYADTGDMVVLSRIAHSSGQWVETGIRVGRPSDLKEIGGALTYGKRYGIQALLSVQADEDLDADPQHSTRVRGGRKEPATAMRHDQDPPQSASPRTNGAPVTQQARVDQKRAPESQPRHPSREQLTRLHTIKAVHHVPDEILKRKLHEDYGLDTTKALSLEQYQSVCNWLASQQPSPAPEEDVPDGLVPDSDAAWNALEERSKAIGWTGLQWSGAREHLGYADVLAEIVALEPDPTQPELA